MSLAKRFYKTATAFADGAGFGVRLDQRELKTAGGASFRAPTQALAEACAAEWDAQAEHINPKAMPLTQFAFAAIDHTPRRRGELIEYVSAFGQTDLCCHRAGAPAELAARQAELWDPLLAHARDAIGFDPPVVTGIIAAPADQTALSKAVEALDDFHLTALAQAAGLAGSAIIALALLHGRVRAEAAYAAATVDEHWSIAHWGEDAEARARLDRTRTEFDALARFSAALR